MERLKLLCEEKVCGDISVGTAATQLVLAEQHGCPKLKVMCMEFMGHV
jgi:speckle-type POZ protein